MLKANRNYKGKVGANVNVRGLKKTLMITSSAKNEETGAKCHQTLKFKENKGNNKV